MTSVTALADGWYNCFNSFFKSTLVMASSSSATGGPLAVGLHIAPAAGTHSGRASDSKADRGDRGSYYRRNGDVRTPDGEPHLYDAQIPPVVYLSGVLRFVAGLAIVRAHNRWTRDWTVLVTISGWFAMALGLLRMFDASSYQRRTAIMPSGVLIALESLLLIIGVIMTVKAYWPGRSSERL